MLSTQLPIFHILSFVFLMLLTSSCAGPRSSNAGIIVPANPANKTHQQGVYDPKGKRPAPTHLSGVTIPTHLLYGTGTVVASSHKKPGTYPGSSSSSKIVIHSNAHNSQNRPSQPLDIANQLISQILGGTPSQSYLNPNNIPSNSGMNIQVVQPFYAHPNGYYFGPSSIQAQSGPPPFQVLARPGVYGSYHQRYGQGVFGYEEEGNTEAI